MTLSFVELDGVQQQAENLASKQIDAGSDAEVDANSMEQGTDAQKKNPDTPAESTAAPTQQGKVEPLLDAADADGVDADEEADANGADEEAKTDEPDPKNV